MSESSWIGSQPPSLNEGKQLTFHSLSPPRFAKKLPGFLFFSYSITFGRFSCSASGSGSDFTPRQAFKAYRKELWDSSSLNSPSASVDGFSFRSGCGSSAKTTCFGLSAFGFFIADLAGVGATTDFYETALWGRVPCLDSGSCIPCSYLMLLILFRILSL